MSDKPLAAPGPVGGPNRPAKTGATVIVACRIPHGLELRAFEMRTVSEQTRTGTVEVEEAYEIGDRFVVRGPGRSRLTGLQPEHIETLHPGGYAITQGCPAELWAAWLSDNRRAPYVVREDIFAESSMERARNHAIENGADPRRETGLEPIDADNPGKRVRGEGGMKIERSDVTRPAQ